MKQLIYIIVISVLVIGIGILYISNNNQTKELQKTIGQKDLENQNLNSEIEALNNEVENLKSNQNKNSEGDEIATLVIPDFIQRTNSDQFCSEENTNIKNLQINNSQATLKISCFCGNVCGYDGDYILNKELDSWIIKSFVMGPVS